MPNHRTIAAHHEAGHAVIALAFLVPVRSASIRPRRASFGRVITPELPDTAVDVQLFITLAGPFAHRRFAPRSSWLTDVGLAANMILGEGGKGTAAAKQKHLAYMVRRAEEAVDYFWADIK